LSNARVRLDPLVLGWIGLKSCDKLGWIEFHNGLGWKNLSTRPMHISIAKGHETTREARQFLKNQNQFRMQSMLEK